jgi:hypothetical protein
MTLSLITLCHYAESYYAESYYAECYFLFIVLQIVVMLNVVILSVVAPPPMQVTRTKLKGDILILAILEHFLFKKLF